MVFTASTALVFGEDKQDIEIKFNLGDTDLHINSDVVTVPAPYSMGEGTTMVPLRVITEAFGAEVDWNANEKKITITYENFSITMYINNKNAIINGSESAMSEAPVIKNGTTMVPLRFISEKFGAEVSYDETTKGITVKKSVNTPVSDADSQLNENENINVNELLNIDSKGYTGDSNFKWYMKNSPSFSLSERNFDGSRLVFEDDNDNAIVVYIDNDISDSFTIDEAISNEKENSDDKTLVSQKKFTENGAECFEISYKTKEETIYTKLFLKDHILYDFNAYVSNESEKQDADLTLELFNSITLGYNDDGSISDLSSLNESGSRKFEQTKLKISMNLPASWSQYNDDSNKINVFQFRDKFGSDENSSPARILLRMYSKESNLSLSDWALRDAKELKEMYNPNYYTQKSTSGKIGVYDYCGYDETIKAIGDYPEIKGRSYYIYGKNYRYQITVFMTGDDYNNKDKYNEIMEAVNSFRFEEPDEREVGLLSEDYENNKERDSKTKEFENKSAHIKFKLPISWKDSGDLYIGDEYSMMSMRISADSANMTSSLIANVAEGLKKQGIKVLESKNSAGNLAGSSASYIKYVEDLDGEPYIFDAYFFKHNDKVVCISIGYPEMYAGERVNSLIENILKSVTGA